MKFVMDVIKENGLEIDLVYSGTARIQLGAIIPYLYFHNLISGEFILTIVNGLDEVFVKQFNYLDIKNGKTEDYIHVYHPIVCPYPVPIENGSYTIGIYPVSGYEPTGNNFLGWIKQHEDIQVPMSYGTLSDAKNPYTIRFKEYSRIHS